MKITPEELRNLKKNIRESETDYPVNNCRSCGIGKPILDHEMSGFFTPTRYYFCPVCGSMFRGV